MTLVWGRSLAWSGCQRFKTTDEPGALEVVGSNPTDPINVLHAILATAGDYWDDRNWNKIV